MANTPVRSGMIHGATTMAPITTAALSANSPMVAIKHAPRVRITKGWLSSASES
ncbi:hypothetical protein [Synechococcus sp. KORDI-100]|uniref:hypothetical protein n=1 Tax=Synechococcus sp. KORDI-100 TaxID=1280380 RepID=UPI001EF6BF27|nr:hypothetical protein [Synechococcus sp. KORDI-100]